MECAPLLVTTLNRHVHFIRLIESLKKNTWAKFTPVYVAVDYPPSEKYIDGYQKICKYLEGNFSEFLDFVVIKRDCNYGSLKNMVTLRDMVLAKYDRFIRTDDDAEFSPVFLEYMNKCLVEYEANPNIIAVCGYSYPIMWRTNGNANVIQESFICPMWGTGFWRSKYNKMTQYISTEGGLARDSLSLGVKRGFRQMTDVCRSEFVDLCLSPDFRITLASFVTDISLRMYMAYFNKCVIMPIESKVRNWGFDGSGEFCENIISNEFCTAKTYSYHLQQIDMADKFDLITSEPCYDSENRCLMNKFDPIPYGKKIYTYMKLIAVIILGAALYKKLTILIRRIKIN